MLLAAGILGLTFTISLVVFCGLVVALPADYFVAERPRFWRDRHPLLRWLGIIGKNLLGLGLIVLGVLLSIPGIPGQGLLTIVVGVMLLDVPGKHRLAQLVMRRRGVLRRINRLRFWFGRPALVVD